MEKLKNELYKTIESLGCLHPKTIKISQELDLMIVEEMKKNNKTFGKLDVRYIRFST